MPSKQRVLAQGALVACLLFCAQSQARGSFYAGVDLGVNKAHVNESTFQSILSDPTTIPISSDLDRTDTLISAFAGYELSPYLGAELAYLDLGETTYNKLWPFFFGDADLELVNRTRALQLVLIGRYPLKSNFRLVANGGIAAAVTTAYMDISLDGTPAIVTLQDDKVSRGLIVAGLGAEWLPHPRWLIRIMARRYVDLDSGVTPVIQQVDMTSVSAGVAFRF